MSTGATPGACQRARFFCLLALWVSVFVVARSAPAAQPTGHEDDARGGATAGQQSPGGHPLDEVWAPQPPRVPYWPASSETLGYMWHELSPCSDGYWFARSVRRRPPARGSFPFPPSACCAACS